MVERMGGERKRERLSVLNHGHMEDSRLASPMGSVLVIAKHPPLGCSVFALAGADFFPRSLGSKSKIPAGSRNESQRWV